MDFFVELSLIDPFYEGEGAFGRAEYSMVDGVGPTSSNPAAKSPFLERAATNATHAHRFKPFSSGIITKLGPIPSSLDLEDAS